MVLAHDIREGIRTKDVKITQDVTFETMLLSSQTLKGLQGAGFHKPSPIQLHGIPLGKCGFDLLLEAKSGTGKTAVFSVIALEKLDLTKGLQVVILAPTREIAAQICDVLKVIGSQYSGLCVEVVMGGLPVQDDIAKFRSKRKVHVVVGSPGRLRHLIQDNFIDTSAVRLLVLDEADKLMEKSFQADINYIFATLPKQKQIIMSSATYPEETKKFIDQYVQNSQHVCPETTNILLGIEQKVTVVRSHSNIVNQTKYRYVELLKILTTNPFKQCLIFCNYQARVVDLYKMLSRDKWPSEQLYGHQEQTDRLDALKTLQEYRCRILISTDLAARGIDASNVDLVINFEPPHDWPTYLHRIGRAGRYGSFGISITILSEGAEEIKFKKILLTMKDSLNICDLWTNNKINFDCFTSPSTEPQEKSVKEISEPCISDTKPNLQQIWNEISVPSSSSVVLESFENLNKSFENENIQKNETFSELLDSYENSSTDANEATSYANIKVSNKSINQYLQYLQSVKSKTSETEIIKIPKKLYVKDIHNNSQNLERIMVENMVNTIFKKTELEHTDKQNEEKQKESHIETVHDHSSGMEKNVTSNKNYESNEDVETGLENEMARLGLPIAFGKKWGNSSSNQNKVTGEEEKTEDEEVAQHRRRSKRQGYQQRLDSDVTNDQQAHRSNSTKSRLSKLSDASGLEADESDDKAHCWTKSNKQHLNSSKPSKQECYNEYEIYDKHLPKPKKLHSKQTYKTRVSESSDEKVSSTSHNCKASKHERYIQWYNQLKFRTRQLELAFYIQEMST